MRTKVRAPLLIFHDRKRNVRRILFRTIDLVSSDLKIFRLRIENIWNKRLRISINYRKPGALDLNHDAMIFQKAVILSMQTICIFLHFIRLNRFRLFKTIPITSTKYFIRNHELIARQIPILRIKFRIYINQFHNPISIGAGC